MQKTCKKVCCLISNWFHPFLDEIVLNDIHGWLLNILIKFIKIFSTKIENQSERKKASELSETLWCSKRIVRKWMRILFCYHQLMIFIRSLLTTQTKHFFFIFFKLSILRKSNFVLLYNFFLHFLVFSSNKFSFLVKLKPKIIFIIFIVFVSHFQHHQTYWTNMQVL